MLIFDKFGSLLLWQLVENLEVENYCIRLINLENICYEFNIIITTNYRYISIFTFLHIQILSRLRGRYVSECYTICI